MAKRSLKRLNLDEKVVDRLSKQNMTTCQDVLSLSRLEILKLLGISDRKRQELINAISNGCAPKHHTAYEIYQAKKTKVSFLSLSIPQLDNLLGGGLPVGNVTEIAGPSGVGKTQFCFMLSVLATMPIECGGLDGQVMFIDTESTFCAKRLMSIAKTRFPNVYTSEEDLKKLLQRVFVYPATNTDALGKILHKAQWDIIRTSSKLVIVDSVASLVRKEFGTAGVVSRFERSNLLVEQAALLKNLAESLGIAVVVTNQITTSFQTSDATLMEARNSDSSLFTDQERVAPALGVTWAHCVNTRFVAEFMDCNRRRLILAKSSLAKCASAIYTIQNEGIVVDGPVSTSVTSDPLLCSLQTKYQFLESEML